MNTLGKSSAKGRTGPQATIYSVKRNPALDRDDYIKGDTNKPFGFVNDSTYKGNWNDNAKEGFGVETKSDGTKYEGEWKNNMRDGKGTLYIKKGNKYIQQYAGEWHRNMKDGYGICNYPDQNIYKGNWKRGVRSGHGRMDYTNGDSYIGEWNNDLRHGQGTHYQSNGNIYEGHFLNDIKEGPGRFYYAATHKVYEGEWVDDSPKCGEFREPTEDELPRFGKAAIHKLKFALPPLMLENIRSVLDCTIAATRNSRALHRGVANSNAQTNVENDMIERAERVFQEHDTTSSGVIPFNKIHFILEVLDVHLSQDDISDLMLQLEIMPNTGVSFPEIIDIATFCQDSH